MRIIQGFYMYNWDLNKQFYFSFQITKIFLLAYKYPDIKITRSLLKYEYRYS